MMNVYLDNCMFNRPFDDQTNLRISLETQAKLYIQQLIREGKLQLIWSYMLDFENDLNPFEERRNASQKWRKLAVDDISETPELMQYAKFFLNLGIAQKDALHVACALMANADYFLSTDDKFLKKLKKQDKINGINPVEFIGVINDN